MSGLTPEFIFFALVGAAIVWLVFDLRKKLANAEKEKTDATARLTELEQRLADSVHKSAGDVREQLRTIQESFDRRLEENTTKLDTRLDNAAKSFSDVKALMSRVEESNKRIYDVGKDVSSLQDILRSPKMRGGFGELQLARILEEMLPKDFYEVQHTFKSGEIVDAIIKLKDSIISVDSKFSWDNFQRMNDKNLSDDERKKFRRTFYADIRKHVDAIAAKYILPDEKTLDFALMYIPSESVYYETIVADAEDKNLLEYFFSKKVIPVSPNSFYAYLMTIVFGLRGLQIEERAKDIMTSIGKLAKEQEKFGQEFSVLGSHLSNAAKKFDEADRRLDKVHGGMEQLSARSATQLENGTDEKES